MKLTTLLLLFFWGDCWAADTVLPAHSHNDYTRSQPLLLALNHRFRSVEADIHLLDGKLLVGHDPQDLVASRTLEEIYLQPLSARVKNNQGRIYDAMPPLFLLVDFKTAAEPTYAALKPVLDNYRHMLTSFQGEKVITNAVTVIISGNRPWKLIASEPSRLVALDGRLADLDKGYSANLVPLISDNWTLHFTWRGQGRLPESEWTKLRSCVDKTHSQGKLIRLWATPDNPQVWTELHRAGLDLINTDDIPGLAAFLRESTEAPTAKN